LRIKWGGGETEAEKLFFDLLEIFVAKKSKGNQNLREAGQFQTVFVW
jgi:hypothetical protein